MAAPVNLVRARLEREGFLSEARAKTTSGFERISPAELSERLQRAGLSVTEIVAVAPSLGADPVRIAAVRPDPAAWSRLLEVEEAVGRSVARHPGASALLVAAERVGARAALDPTDVLSKRR
jgi:hypothetical protein